MFVDWTETNGFMDTLVSPGWVKRPLPRNKAEMTALKKRLKDAGTAARWSTGWFSWLLNSPGTLVEGHAAPEYKSYPAYNKIGIPFYFKSLKTYNINTSLRIESMTGSSAVSVWEDVGDFVSKVSTRLNGVPNATVCVATTTTVYSFSLHMYHGTIRPTSKTTQQNTIVEKLRTTYQSSNKHTTVFVGKFGEYTDDSLAEDVDLGGEQFYVPQKLDEFKETPHNTYSATNIIRLNEWAQNRLNPNKFSKIINFLKKLAAVGEVNAAEIYVGSGKVIGV